MGSAVKVRPPSGGPPTGHCGMGLCLCLPMTFFSCVSLSIGPPSFLYQELNSGPCACQAGTVRLSSVPGACLLLIVYQGSLCVKKPLQCHFSGQKYSPEGRLAHGPGPWPGPPDGHPGCCRQPGIRHASQAISQGWLSHAHWPPVLCHLPPEPVCHTANGL